MQRHGQSADRHGLARRGVRFGQHLAHEIDAGGDRFAGAADGLDVQRAQPAGETLFLHQAADLVDLAAQTENDDMGEVGVARVAGERPAQHAQRLVLGHAAAGLVGQRDDAVDVGVIRQRVVAGERIALEHVGDETGDMGGTIHAGQDADVIARRDLAVGPADALERGRRVEDTRWVWRRRHRRSPWRSRPFRNSARARAGPARCREDAKPMIWP